MKIQEPYSLVWVYKYDRRRIRWIKPKDESDWYCYVLLDTPA